MIGIYEEMKFGDFSEAVVDYFTFEARNRLFDILHKESRVNNAPYLFNIDRLTAEWKEFAGSDWDAFVEWLQKLYPNHTEVYKLRTGGYLIRLEVSE